MIQKIYNKKTFIVLLSFMSSNQREKLFSSCENSLDNIFRTGLLKIIKFLKVKASQMVTTIQVFVFSIVLSYSYFFSQKKSIISHRVILSVISKFEPKCENLGKKILPKEHKLRLQRNFVEKICDITWAKHSY